MVVRVAAYQAPLTLMDQASVVALIRTQLTQCEADAVEVLCCPETVLGGLGDFALDPAAEAVGVETGELAGILAPLASPTVTVIVGFSEQTSTGALFNSAAILQRGTIVGIYRKNRPARRRSVYQAGQELPVFRAGALTFGVLICNDSNYPELAGTLAGKGAQAIFIPSNNGLPLGRGDVVAETRMADVAIARAYDVAVIRADVAGRTVNLEAYGTSAITQPGGTDQLQAETFTTTLLRADLDLGGAPWPAASRARPNTRLQSDGPSGLAVPPGPW